MNAFKWRLVVVAVNVPALALQFWMMTRATDMRWLVNVLALAIITTSAIMGYRAATRLDARNGGRS
jgi:hypothetical protein